MGNCPMGLNKEQSEAVRYNAGPCMVLAGPGTGKTTVITSRVANLVKNKIVPPENILVVTFSRGAVNEMKNRYSALLGIKGTGGVSFGTFHSVFYKLLRHYKGYRLEDLIDESRKYNLIKNIVKRQLSYSVEDESRVKNIITDMEYVISTISDASKIRTSSCDSCQLVSIIEEYKAQKEQSGKYDYDDILYDCMLMLKEDPDILKEVRERFKYILVDEFQDINALQCETIRLIAEPLNNIFIVGDDDQSIYGFRGAAPNILLSFEKIYPECSRIFLNTNYRSTESILSSALSIINNNINRYSKSLKAANTKGDPPKILETENFDTEAGAIASMISIMSGRDKKYSGYAVIYRTNIQSRAIEDAFIEAKLPFVSLDGVPSLYDHWIFKDIISYLRLGAGIGDNRDLIRIINKPKRFISRNTLERAAKQGSGMLQWIMDQEGLNRLQANGIYELIHDLKRLGTMNLKNAAKYIRNVMGYDEYLMEYAALRGISIRGLMDTAEEFEGSAASFENVSAFMQRSKDVAERIRENDYCDLGSNNVKIMTMHKAKGLEFDTVFVCGSIEGLTPYIKHDSPANTDFEEERRLFYVAVTRARKELYITVPRHRYGKAVLPSRFLEELRNGSTHGGRV